MSVREYRKYATLRVDAINHALRGIPRENSAAPRLLGELPRPAPQRYFAERHRRHHLRVRARATRSRLEPGHEHEWRVFEQRSRPKGAVLFPASSATARFHRAPPARSPSGCSATRSSSVARTSNGRNRLRPRARASGARRCRGRSSRRSRKARAWRARACGCGRRNLRRNARRRERRSEAALAVIPAKSGNPVSCLRRILVPRLRGTHH